MNSASSIFTSIFPAITRRRLEALLTVFFLFLTVSLFAAACHESIQWPSGVEITAARPICSSDLGGSEHTPSQPPAAVRECDLFFLCSSTPHRDQAIRRSPVAGLPEVPDFRLTAEPAPGYGPGSERVFHSQNALRQVLPIRAGPRA